jgi:hypothetical protein
MPNFYEIRDTICNRLGDELWKRYIKTFYGRLLKQGKKGDLWLSKPGRLGYCRIGYRAIGLIVLQLRRGNFSFAPGQE